MLVVLFEKGPEPANVFGQSTGTVRQVIVTAVGHPPRGTTILVRYGFVQGLAVGNVHLLVETAV
jgi:hypothetical protein